MQNLHNRHTTASQAEREHRPKWGYVASQAGATISFQLDTRTPAVQTATPVGAAEGRGGSDRRREMHTSGCRRVQGSCMN